MILNLQVLVSDKKPVTEDSKVVGIDLNVSNFLIDSNGREIEHLKQLLYVKWTRVRREQKKLSRKQVSS